MKTVFLLVLLGTILSFVPRYTGVRLMEEELSRESMAPLAREALENLKSLYSITDEVDEKMSLSSDDENFHDIREYSAAARYNLSAIYGYYLAENHEKPYENDLMSLGLLSAALLKLAYMMIRSNRRERAKRDLEPGNLVV